jgi:hypothetical protein
MKAKANARGWMPESRALALGVIALGAGALGFVHLGCGAETAFDCDRVCTRYKDCYDASYDVGACRDRCRSNAEKDATVKAKADACEECIGDMSCLSATFNCSQDCSAIVP